MTPATKVPASVRDDLDRLTALAAARAADLLAAADPASWLYAHWYAQAGSRPVPPEMDDLRPRLRAALPASCRWGSGWVVVEARESGACVAGKGAERRHLPVGDFANLARPFMPPMPGDLLSVTERLDWSDEQTGFWHVQSAIGPPEPALVRLYLSLEVLHVVDALRGLTNVLDGHGARYALKCPATAAAFDRRDSLVCYVEAAAWAHLEGPILAGASDLQLEPEGPPLTRPLRPGLSFAEDPGTGRSFGETICAALAPAARNIADGGAPGRTLIAALADAGLDPAAPWRRPAP